MNFFYVRSALFATSGLRNGVGIEKTSITSWSRFQFALVLFASLAVTHGHAQPATSSQSNRELSMVETLTEGGVWHQAIPDFGHLTGMIRVGADPFDARIQFFPSDLANIESINFSSVFEFGRLVSNFEGTMKRDPRGYVQWEWTMKEPLRQPSLFRYSIQELFITSQLHCNMNACKLSHTIKARVEIPHWSMPTSSLRAARTQVRRILKDYSRTLGHWSRRVTAQPHLNQILK